MRIAQKDLKDEEEYLSHYSNSPKRSIPSQKALPHQKQKKFDSFLQRFKKYENHYQHRRDEAIQQSQQKNDSATKNVPTICQKSKTMANEYQTLPLYDRLHQSQYKMVGIKNVSSEKSKPVNQSYTGTTKFQRSKSCDKLASTKDKTNYLLSTKFINDYTEIIKYIKGTTEIADFNTIQLFKNEFQVIMMNLGFIGYKMQPDQKISISANDSDILEEIETLLKTLNNEKKSINSASVLIFLLIIQGLCPSQTFFCENEHILKAQQITLQQQYCVLKYTRNAYLMQKRRDVTQQENQSRDIYTPFISTKSNRYAEKRRKSLLENTNISQTVHVSQQTLWNITDLIQHSKIDQLSSKLEFQKHKECQFRPILNPITNQINQIQRSQKKISVSPTSRLYSTKKRIESLYVKENSIDQECTFQPKISKGSGFKGDQGFLIIEPLDKVSYDSNRSATIQQAFQTQQFKNSMLERGYPKHIKDWTSHVQKNRKPLSKSFSKQNQNIKQKVNQEAYIEKDQSNIKQENLIPNHHKPLLFVDVNIGDTNDRLVVYPDQNIDLVVQNFSLKHNLDAQMTKQFRVMLESKIRNILFPIHEVQNSQNYEF